MDSQTDKYAICRHIRTSGHRCQSPALAGSLFCFYHRALRRSHDAASTAKVGPLRPETVQYLLQHGQSPSQFAPSPTLNFPPLEDAESIQLNISLLFAAIAAGQIDPILARNLLYALQIASCNLRVLPSGSAAGNDFFTLARRVVRTRDGQALAARATATASPRKPKAANRSLRRCSTTFSIPKTLPQAPQPKPQPKPNDYFRRNENRMTTLPAPSAKAAIFYP